MKLTPSLLTVVLSLGAASAFGFKTNSAPAASINVRSNVPFVGGVQDKQAAMVQHLGIDGQPRMNADFALQSSSSSDATKARGGALSGIDVPLMLYFVFWYLGNYFYNITNKLALKAAGGSAGFPMTISTLQLGVGCIYGLFLWVAPDGRAKPTVTMDDIIKMLPVAFCFMGAHSASVFALSAGAVSFGQIVKSAEPAFAAVLSQFVYKKNISKAKWLCLPIVIGGVILASVKELDFAVSALVSACIANLFAAFKGNENKKLMETPGIRERLGSVGNQFAVTTLLAFLMSIPVFVAKEGARWGQFVEIFKTNPVVSFNLLASGLYF